MLETPIDKLPELLTVAEAAELARCSRAHMWRLIRERGEVQAIRIGAGRGPLRVPRDSFLEWLHGEPERGA